MLERENQDQKPKSLKPIFENIPLELKQMNRWVLWEYKYSEGRNTAKPWTKVPKVARNPKWYAKTNAPETWSAYEAAEYQHELADGIGIVIGEGKVGIDLDACVSDGVIEPWASSIINCINSYTEYSPSGTGIRIILTGAMPGEYGTRRYRNGKIEIYDDTSPRYLTITGHRVAGTIKAVASRQEQLNQVYATYLGGPITLKEKIAPENKPTPVPIVSAQVDEIIEIASRAKNSDKFLKLWSGSLTEHDDDHSRADQALCNMLCFYCGPNEELIDEVFKESGLYRDKWDREDYKHRTIQNSIDNTSEYYKWSNSDEEAQVNAIVTGGEVGDHTGQENQNPFANTTALIPQPSTIELRKYSQLKAIAATQTEDWLIDKWAEFGTLLFHTSLPFGGKSTLWAWIMAAIAKNEPWAGLTTQSVPIVLFDFENKERITVARLEKYLRGNEGRLEELLYAVNHQTITYPLTDATIASILDAIQPAIEAAGGKCLVLIDTLRSAFVGEDYDEVDPSSMVKLLRPLQQVAKKYNACVVVLHHNAKYSNSYSGSTAIAAVADTLWNWKSDKTNLTGELIMDGTRGDSQYPLHFAYDMNDQRYFFVGTENDCTQEDEEKRIYQVIKYLEGTEHKTPNELVAPTGMSESGVKRLLIQAYNQHYVTRQGTGKSGSPYQYIITGLGVKIIEKYSYQDKLGLLNPPN